MDGTWKVLKRIQIRVSGKNRGKNRSPKYSHSVSKKKFVSLFFREIVAHYFSREIPHHLISLPFAKFIFRKRFAKYERKFCFLSLETLV